MVGICSPALIRAELVLIKDTEHPPVSLRTNDLFPLRTTRGLLAALSCLRVFFQIRAEAFKWGEQAVLSQVENHFLFVTVWLWKREIILCSEGGAGRGGDYSREQLHCNLIYPRETPEEKHVLRWSEKTTRDEQVMMRFHNLVVNLCEGSQHKYVQTRIEQISFP